MGMKIGLIEHIYYVFFCAGCGVTGVRVPNDRGRFTVYGNGEDY